MNSIDSLTTSDELANLCASSDREDAEGFGCLHTDQGSLPLRRCAAWRLRAVLPA